MLLSKSSGAAFSLNSKSNFAKVGSLAASNMQMRRKHAQKQKLHSATHKDGRGANKFTTGVTMISDQSLLKKGNPEGSGGGVVRYGGRRVHNDGV